VGSFAAFTFLLSDIRVKIRRKMNAADNEARCSFFDRLRTKMVSAPSPEASMRAIQ
jgi:ABC-type transport system involved in Fe-S cluster assembly fused permease/ATPase subunit